MGVFRGRAVGYSARHGYIFRSYQTLRVVGDSVPPMHHDLTPTDVAFALAGLMQLVSAVLWLIGSRMIGDDGRPALYWSAFAVLSAFSFVFLVAALNTAPPLASELLRAAGNISIVLAVISLQRGIWCFFGQPMPYRGHAVALVVALLASWIGLNPAAGHIRVGVLSGVQAALGLSIAYGFHRYARDTLQLRWPALMTLPLLLAGGAYAARGIRALWVPGSVSAEMTVDSGLNVVSALTYVVLSLSLHAMLMLLVVTRLVKDLHRLSRNDGLTGLLNRRALEEALASQVQRSRRSGEPFCVLMVDADHFKSINDRWGHPVGDLVLKHLSAVLRGRMREVDQIGRFGGEEFLIVLPGLAMVAALPVAERLRELVAAAPLLHGTECIPISISIGLAHWGGGQEEASRLLVRADAALYRAKQQGRDRVAVADVDTAQAR